AAEVYRFVLGFDYSWGSIRAARELLRRGTWRHRRRVEGTLTEPVTYTAPPARNLEFIVADVQHPPLPRHRAAAVAGMHLLDRVPDPFAALDALDNLLMPSGRLVLTASFSWDAAYAATERWLGGTPEAGESLPNLIRLLEAKGYSGLSTQEVCLVIRETRRFYQVSCGALVTGRKR
ncbi:MAG TPA: hypothetical protein VEI97_12795, partial [bacterium]|nr:hypothetical protein [bacterium]